MTAPHDPWSDERLAAALVARAEAAGAAPLGLADAVVSRIAVDARRPRRRFAWSGSFAAGVAAVVIIAAIVGVSRSKPPGSATQPPPATGAGATNTRASSGATTSASGAVPASRVASSPALEPIDVSEALRIRDRFHDGRELTVQGFLSPEPMVFCPMVLSSDVMPPLVYCPGSFLWLMETAERTVTGNTVEAPRGPAFHPSFGVVGMDTVASWPAPSADPVETVLVGHFDDRRSSLCNSARYGGPAECRRTFVVDQIESFGGVEQPVSTSDRRTPGVAIHPMTSVDDVDRLVGDSSHDQPILSRVLLPGAALWSVEPSLRGEAAYLSARLVWVITTLDGSGGVAVSRTWLIIDGSSSVGRMTTDNLVSLALATSPPDQTVLCGRYRLETCAATLALVRGKDPSDVDTASKIVVDDNCPPTPTVCDRLYAFDGVVVLVSPPPSAVPWVAYHVVGASDHPEEVQAWTGELPRHISAMLGVAISPVIRPSQPPGAS